MRVYNLLWQLKLDLRLRSQIWNLRDHRGTTGAEASLITGTEICSTIDGWVAKVQVWSLVCVLSSFLSVHPANCKETQIPDSFSYKTRGINFPFPKKKKEHKLASKSVIYSNSSVRFFITFPKQS